MRKYSDNQFFQVADHLNSHLDFTILKIIMKEKALSAREIAEVSHYSVREIQTVLHGLVNEKIVIRENLPGIRFPVYYLNPQLLHP